MFILNSCYVNLFCFTGEKDTGPRQRPRVVPSCILLSVCSVVLGRGGPFLPVRHIGEQREEEG